MNFIYLIVSLVLVSSTCNNQLIATGIDKFTDIQIDKYDTEAIIYIINNDITNAKDIAQKLIALSPNSATGYMRLSEVLFLEGDKKQSDQALERGKEIDPNAYSLFQYNKHILIDNLVHNYNRDAIFYTINSKIETASNKIIEIMRLAPDRALGYMRMSEVRYLQSKKTESDKLFNEGRTINPNAASLLVFYITKAFSDEPILSKDDIFSQYKDVYFSRNQLDNLINIGTQVIEAYPQVSASMYKVLGDCYYYKYLDTRLLHYLSKAKNSYKIAASLNSIHNRELLFIFEVFWKKSIWRECDKMAKTISEIDPDNQILREYLDWKEERREQKSIVEEHRRKLAELSMYLDLTEEYQKLEYYLNKDPNNVELTLWLGIAYWNKAKEGYDEFERKAEQTLKKAIELDPQFTYARKTLGDYYLYRNNIPKAAEQYGELQKIDPKSLTKEMIDILMSQGN